MKEIKNARFTNKHGDSFLCLGGMVVPSTGDLITLWRSSQGDFFTVDNHGGRSGNGARAEGPPLIIKYRSLFDAVRIPNRVFVHVMDISLEALSADSGLLNEFGKMY